MRKYEYRIWQNRDTNAAGRAWICKITDLGSVGSMDEQYQYTAWRTPAWAAAHIRGYLGIKKVTWNVKDTPHLKIGVRESENLY